MDLFPFKCIHRLFDFLHFRPGGSEYFIRCRTDAVVASQIVPDPFSLPENQKTGGLREILFFNGVTPFIPDAKQVHQLASPVDHDLEVQFDGFFHFDCVFRVHVNGNDTNVQSVEIGLVFLELNQLLDTPRSPLCPEKDQQGRLVLGNDVLQGDLPAGSGVEC